MGYTLNILKNKIRRLKIEVHHSRNKTSYKDPVIQSRDPIKPLLTLRTHQPSHVSQFEVERTIREESLDQDQFAGFSDVSNEEIINEREKRRQTLLESSIRSYFSSQRRHSSRDEVEESLVCTCACHSSRKINLRAPFYHDNKCLEVCDVIEKNDNGIPLVNMTNNDSKIDSFEPKPANRGFWLFKRKKPVLKISQNLPYSEDQLNDNTPEEDFVSERPTLASGVQRIEIIAQSTTANSEHSENQPVNSLRASINKTIKNSTSFKRHNKTHLNFSRPNSQVASDSINTLPHASNNNNRSIKANEPWKMIMNDISLHAALLSTGSRPKLSKSSLNLAADFTSSKYNPSRPISNNYTPSELISLSSVPPPLTDDLALDEELARDFAQDENTVPIAFLRTGGPFHQSQYQPKNNIENNSTRPSTKKSKISLVSDTLERDIFRPAETSAVYGGVFQDYNYSDESLEGWKNLETSKTQLLNRATESEANLIDSNSEVLPLNISHRDSDDQFF